MERSPFATIDDYLASAPAPVRPALQEIRRVVSAAIPSAQETISYRMPAFKLGRTFFYFAAFKKHVGIYPPVRQDKALVKELLAYRGPKGNLSFPLDQPLPYELIRRVAVALAREHAKK